MAKKYIDIDVESKEIFSILFREGIDIAARKFNDEISDKHAVILLYYVMRPFEKYDFHNQNNKIMKIFSADEEIFKSMFSDMSDVAHSACRNEDNLHVEDRKKISFRTKTTFKGAFRIFVALARSILGKDTVKKIMKSCGIKFKKYGSKKSREHYVEKNKRKNRDIINFK